MIVMSCQRCLIFWLCGSQHDLPTQWHRGRHWTTKINESLLSLYPRAGKTFTQLHFIAWPLPITPTYSIPSAKFQKQLYIACSNAYVKHIPLNCCYLFVPLQLFGPESPQKYHVPNLDGRISKIGQKKSLLSWIQLIFDLNIVWRYLCLIYLFWNTVSVPWTWRFAKFADQLSLQLLPKPFLFRQILSSPV